MKRLTGAILLFVLDITSINLALVLAFYLRFDGAIPPEQFSSAWNWRRCPQ